MPENKKAPTPIGSVVSSEIFPDCERVDFETLLGAKIVISAIKPLKGQFGQYVVFKFTRAGEDKEYSTSTGAQAVVDQLMQVEEKGAFPVEAEVAQPKGYFVLQ